MKRGLPALFGAVTIAQLLEFMSRDYPYVGLDFVQYLPRLTDTDIFIRINGLVPQWYTPSFAGGMPAFANPQHFQYSVVQLLFLVVGPWHAVLISTALACAVGFAAFYRFLRDVLEISDVASTLGAMGLVANGFYIQHIAGGALGFQLFPMIGVFLYAATSRRLPAPAAAAIVGLTAAAIIHAGGGLIAVLIGGSLVLSLQVAHLLAPSAIDPRRIAVVGVAGAALALALCASKLYAVQAFMVHFPRTLADHYPIGILHALFGFATQIAGGMMVIPILFIGGWNTHRYEDAFVGATGAGVHSTEIDAGLQPVLSIALAVAVVRWLWMIRRTGLPPVSRARAIEISLLVATVWVGVETTLARGFIYPALHQLPFFRSMHVNHRVAVIFVVPLAIAAVFAVNAWRAHRKPVIAAVLLTVATVLQASYFLLPARFFWHDSDLTEIERAHAEVRRGERFPVTVMNYIPEDQVFAARASSQQPYEPLFGYDREFFKAEIVSGPIDRVRDGKFNMTNPASLIFPELNGLRRWERISVDDEANLRKLANRQQPQWKMPAILSWLNWLAVITLVACVGMALTPLVQLHRNHEDRQDR